MKIIVGLGNYGVQYGSTYHNMGFMAVDYIAQKLSLNFSANKCESVIAQGAFKGGQLVLAKPTTFMNLSGNAVKKLIKQFKANLSDLIVIYDDIDLPQGNVRVRAKGSAGTHNGMRHIIDTVESEDFCRIRIGIGRPVEGRDLADYVLSNIPLQIRPVFDSALQKVWEEIIKLLI